MRHDGQRRSAPCRCAACAGAGEEVHSAFVSRMLELCRTWIGIEAQIANEEECTDREEGWLCAEVGMEGSFAGHVGFCVSVSLARAITRRLLEDEAAELDLTTCRLGVAELSNFVAGNATSLFSAKRRTIQLMPPRILVDGFADGFDPDRAAELPRATIRTSAGRMTIHSSICAAHDGAPLA